MSSPKMTRRNALCVCAGLPALAACQFDSPLDLVSSDQVEALGLQSWQQITQTTPRSRNSAMQGQADQITGRLLRSVGEDPRQWETVVFARPQINAFALPGRKIGVYEGMFGVAENSDQLAAVIGHEIGHVQADHGEARIEREVATGVGLNIVEGLLRMGDVQFAGEIAGALGLGANYGIILPYSRRQELEADEIGLRLMAGAGYDPAQAVTLWQNMSRANNGAPPEFLSTHPAPASRIEEIQRQLPALDRI